MTCRIISLLAATVFISTVTQAQLDTTKVKVSEIANLSSSDYQALVMPPLSLLLENAEKNNPSVGYFNSRGLQEQSALKSERRAWLKNFKLNTSYQYGKTNGYSSFSDSYTPLFDQYTEKAQDWYSVGASFSLPLSDIFDRRNRIKLQKQKIEASKYEMQQAIDEQALRIVDAYTVAVASLELIQSRAEAMVIAKAQYKMTELDYINGKSDSQVLSRQKNIESSAISAYEEVRTNLNNALLKLEIMTKTKIINK